MNIFTEQRWFDGAFTGHREIDKTTMVRPDCLERDVFTGKAPNIHVKNNDFGKKKIYNQKHQFSNNDWYFIEMHLSSKR